MNLERIVEVTGAYDRRHPDPDKNYGVHGMDIRFVLKGPEGAVQFLVYTGMHLPHVTREWWRDRDSKYNPFEPMGADIGYHSPVPMYEGHEPIKERSAGLRPNPDFREGDPEYTRNLLPEYKGPELPCPYLDNRPCYSDGSALRAEEFMPLFLKGGSDTVWRMLEEEYRLRFGRETAP